MRTIRLFGMTDAEYEIVSQSYCPYCGSRGTAQTNYSNIHSTFRNVDLTCDACGQSWSISEKTGSLRQLSVGPDMLVIEVSKDAIAKATEDSVNRGKRELKSLSDNMLRHMRKSELVLLADEYGISTDKATKAQLISSLITERDAAHE